MEWMKKSAEIWNIVKKYHVTEYGHRYPVIRCVANLRDGMSGEIEVMRGSSEDCFVQKTFITKEQASNLQQELKPLLKLNEKIETLKLRAAPDEVPRVEATYYLS
jgi:hypothetical protein